MPGDASDTPPGTRPACSAAPPPSPPPPPPHPSASSSSSIMSKQQAVTGRPQNLGGKVWGSTSRQQNLVEAGHSMLGAGRKRGRSIPWGGRHQLAGHGACQSVTGHLAGHGPKPMGRSKVWGSRSQHMSSCLQDRAVTPQPMLPFRPHTCAHPSRLTPPHPTPGGPLPHTCAHEGY